jgi:D-serine deaminase-like pyridoxal phosphate-dependent protein
MEIIDIETPAILVEEPVLKRNIESMQKFSREKGFLLFPHFKTHKSIEIADLQLLHGAKGFTVSGLSEAEILLNHGVKTVIVAYPIVGKKIEKLFELHNKSDGQLSCIVDNIKAAHSISDRFSAENKTINVFLKINVGLNRCGVQPFSVESKKLATEIMQASGLNLRGLLSHAGHAYKTGTILQIKAIAEQEITTLTNVAEDIKDITGKLDCISVGATPTAKFYEMKSHPVFFRPGNYVFNDFTQVSLGVASTEDCALTVLTTVISIPSNDRIIIDAGSKTFSSAVIPIDKEHKMGYGAVLRTLFQKEINKNLFIDYLSEEHAIVRVNTKMNLKIGDRLRIIPNHACTVSNLHNFYYFTQGENVLSRVKIDARGFTT